VTNTGASVPTDDTIVLIHSDLVAVLGVALAHHYGSQVPGRAANAAEDTAGSRIANNLLTFWVPSDFPTQQHCDVTQVRDGRRPMRDLNRRDCSRPRLYAVEKIATMTLTLIAGWPVQVHFLRPNFFLQKALWLGIEPGTCHVNPACRA
jgi:hypothetical protein